jgi:hypothetical protein
MTIRPAWLLLTVTACSGAPPATLEAPAVEMGIQTLVLVRSSPTLRSARAIDLRGKSPPAVQLGTDTVSALYYFDSLADLHLTEGELELMDAGAADAELLPPFAQGFEADGETWAPIQTLEPGLWFRRAAGASVGALSVSLLRWGTGEPLGGVRVCAALPHQVCAESVNGRARLSQLPLGEDLVVTMQMAGLMPTSIMVRLDRPDAVVAGSIFLMEEQHFQAIASALPSDMRQRGAIDFVAFSGQFATDPVPGVRPVLEPLSGDVISYGGGALTVNVPPGDYRIRFQSSRQYCGPSSGAQGWSAGSGEARVRVTAGQVTHIQSVSCTSR